MNWKVKFVDVKHWMQSPGQDKIPAYKWEFEDGICVYCPMIKEINAQNIDDMDAYSNINAEKVILVDRLRNCIGLITIYNGEYQILSSC